MSENKKVKNAVKVEEDGIKFDSRLERFMYQKLRDNRIPFELKTTVELVPKFQFEGKWIRAMNIIPDFYLPTLNTYLDPKGFATPVADLKYKLLRFKLSQENPTAKVVIVKNQKEVIEYIASILQP